MGKADYMRASKDLLFSWIIQGIVTVNETEDGQIEVLNKGKILTQRLSSRRACQNSDPRVDIRHEGFRISVHVSHLVWMVTLQTRLPDGWQIHHLNEDCTDNRFGNLICVHPEDHIKLHHSEEIPF